MLLNDSLLFVVLLLLFVSQSATFLNSFLSIRQPPARQQQHKLYSLQTGQRYDYIKAQLILTVEALNARSCNSDNMVTYVNDECM